MKQSSWTAMIQHQKAALRRQLRELANKTLHTAQKAEEEIRLQQQLISLPAWLKARSVLLFFPLPHEPNLLTLLEKSSHRFFFPRMHNDELELYEWFSGATWIKGLHGVQELDPQQCRKASLAEIDFALIPGLAFDSQGHRLGRGAGYFDRFLGKSECHAFKVGVAWSWQIVPNIPNEPHDVKMDCVITPEKIFHSE